VAGVFPQRNVGLEVNLSLSRAILSLPYLRILLCRVAPHVHPLQVFCQGDANQRLEIAMNGAVD